ncbi:SGNH/GDSL hydrolase family protein [Flavobacterium sp.]|uniref:SGNH/GDSL hydrolase family protein n=1 Tax=Flavobacterium sp. TaxID=239 RepID=UPI003D13B57D
MIKNIKWVLLASFAFMACDKDLEEEVVADVPVTAGEANFSKYVALGDSFGAGYSDKSLFVAGQLNSYPEQMARQFAAAGGGVFKSPLMTDNIGGLLAGGAQIPDFDTRLYFDFATQGPLPVGGKIVNDVFPGVANLGPFNNVSVPGAKSFHLTFAGYGSPAGLATKTANPYYVRFATSPSTTMLADAASQNPTFFSLWIGGNDVLSFATSGGVGVDQTGNTNPLTYGGYDITDPNVFANVYSGIVDQMTKNGAKGVVANLPYVSTLPLFTTVPFNPVPLDAAKVALLNDAFTGTPTSPKYNLALLSAVKNGLITQAEANMRTIVFKVGQNPVVIVDENLKDLSAYGIPSYRQTTKDDFILLPSRTFIGTTVGGNPLLINGLSVPLEDKWVLTSKEAELVKNATDKYNQTIQAVANAKGLAFFDAKAAMDQLLAGNVRFGDYSLTADYVKGGAFSLDGVHPGARGYAFIANKMIEAINAKYKSTIRMIDIGKKPALYPQTIPANNYVN